VSLAPIRARSAVLAIALFALLAGGLEFLARSAPVAAYVASRPADVATEPAHAARLNALSLQPRPRVLVVGDSVALGRIMADHGIGGWQSQELSAALRKALRQERPDIVVANFAGNGLRPADQAELMREAAEVGVDAIVLVVGLRGFSAEFEQEAERYTYPWLRDAAQVAGNGVRLASSSLDPAGPWHFRAVTDFLVVDRLGGPLRTLLTQLREEAKAGQPNPAREAVQALRMRQRLANAGFDPATRFQAGKIAETLRFLNARDVPVVVVYATENPAALPRMMPPAMIARNRAALEGLVRFGGNRHAYLGPDSSMRTEFFLDQMHPTAAGYEQMARRIAPALLGVLK